MSSAYLIIKSIICILFICKNKCFKKFKKKLRNFKRNSNIRFGGKNILRKKIIKIFFN